ncbi:MAG: thioredoxin domain-containing protein [Pseudomonadota bacterium]
MQNKQNDSTMKIIIGAVIIAAIAIGIYFSTNNKSAGIKSGDSSQQHAETKSTFTAEQAKEIEDIVVKVAREQTDVFMKAINEGMQLQQEKTSRELEKHASAEMDAIKKNAIVWGDPKAAMQVYAMIDPMCPHCHDFMRTAIAAVSKSKDVAFTLVIAPILGQNSVAVSKVMLAANAQGADKSKVLMSKFVDKVNDLTRDKLLALIKESGLDEAKFKVDEESTPIQKQLEENVALFEKLKIPGVPTVLLQNKDGTLFVAPPMKPEVYIQLAARTKAGEDISKPPVNEEPKKEEAKPEEAKKKEVKPEEAKKTDKKADSKKA